MRTPCNVVIPADITRLLAPLAALHATGVTNPSFEYFTRPQGIDVAHTQLGWVMNSTRRGDRQAAYQVLVAPSRELLGREVAEVQNVRHLELREMWASIVIRMSLAADYKRFETFQASLETRNFEHKNSKLAYESEAELRYE